MKKLLLLLIFLISISQTSVASHVLGGTMYWRCLNNGQYQFFMEVYADCTGINWGFYEETIIIIGDPLPKDSLGISLNAIPIVPDSAKWFSTNSGDITPSCTNQYGNNYTCDNKDPGTVRQFFYKSEPFTMKGVPPTDGWKFFYESACCRPGSIENITTTGNMLLRASMFRTKDSDQIDSCFYSSPQFISPPTTFICRGELSYNNIGIQREGDSISFSWDRPYNPPFGSPVPLDYKPGYSPSDPTPDDTIDSRNKASVLDPVTGNIELAVYSGTSTEKYINVVQIDSWLDGKIVATTYRELPLAIATCPNLPNRTPNKKPEVLLDGKKQRNLSLTFQAGSKINISVKIMDNDTTGVGTNNQMISLKPYGQLYSSDFLDTLACDFPPCATLRNTTPTYDTTELAYAIKDRQTISSTFEWQTNCSHLDRNGKSKTYLFYYKAQDDHCPIPESVSGALKITLVEKNNQSKPSMGYINGFSSAKEISWNAQDISEAGFQQWYIFGSVTENGNYNLIDSVGDYSLQIYLDSISNNLYYYVKAKNLLCNSTNISSFSLASDTIHLDTSSLLLTNVSSFIQLNWVENRSSYRDGEVRKYDIYRSYPVGSAFQYLESVYDASIYNDSIEICDDSVSYFVRGDSSFASRYYFQDTRGIYSPKLEWKDPIRIKNDTLFAAYDLADYQWFDCEANKIVLDEKNNYFAPKDTGIFSVFITKEGCLDSSACIPFFPVGIAELSFKDEISLYPNPTSGIVQIRIAESVNEVTIQVRNIQGQLLQEKQVLNTSLLNWELPGYSGIYFIQLTNEKGEQANLKVVKQ